MNYVSQMSSNNYQAADFKPLESIRKCPRKALPKMCAKKQCIFYTGPLSCRLFLPKCTDGGVQDKRRSQISRRDATLASRKRDGGRRSLRVSEVKAFLASTVFVGLSPGRSLLQKLQATSCSTKKKYGQYASWQSLATQLRLVSFLKLLSCTGARSILRTDRGCPNFSLGY